MSEEHAAVDEGSESFLSSWVLELRGQFAEREAMALPAGIEGSEDLPRVVFLVALCVLDEKLSVVLTLEDDLVADGEVAVASLPAREALVDGESGEDPAEEWFAPLAWDEPLQVDQTAGAPSDGDREDTEAMAQDSPAPDPVWGAATALVREYFTEDVQVALQVGELDDELLVGRRAVGCLVALPRRIVHERVELEAAMVLPLEELVEPDHVEEEAVPVGDSSEVLLTFFLRGRRIPGASVKILQSLLERLGLVERDEPDA